MDIKKLLLFNVFLFTYTYSLNEETFLRNDLMESYNKYVRPVNNYDENLDIKMGLAVQNIEEFDPAENLNTWAKGLATHRYAPGNPDGIMNYNFACK